MKRRFATKLILSGVAFAVSAATLVSTTYAWYVQNSQVTATGVSGTVADTEASSIFISKDYAVATAAATWGPSVAFAAGEHDPAVDFAQKKYIRNVVPSANRVFNGGLDPVTRKTETSAPDSFIYVNGQATKTGVATTETAPSSDNYSITVNASDRKIEFNLYVQTNAAGSKVRPRLIIRNTTTNTTAKTQTAYRDIVADGYYIAGNSALQSGNIEKGETFWSDAVQALRMKMSVAEAVLPVTGENPADGTWGADTISYYDVLSIAKASYDTSKHTYKPYSIVKEIADLPNTVRYVDETQLKADTTVDNLIGAHAYYKGMVGDAPTAGFVDQGTAYVDTSNSGTKGEIADVTLTEASRAYRFNFVLWLEGTDAACFDCCVGQTFEIDVKFDVVS